MANIEWQRQGNRLDLVYLRWAVKNEENVREEEKINNWLKYDYLPLSDKKYVVYLQISNAEIFFMQRILFSRDKVQTENNNEAII